MSMKLPIIEAMQTAQTGQVKALTRHLSFQHEVAEVPEPLRFDRAFEVRTSATLRVDQWADDSRALPLMGERARRMILKEIYGPVEDRLHEILHMLWKEGPQCDPKIAGAVDQLISDLRP